jgi:hypothetical protein
MGNTNYQLPTTNYQLPLLATPVRAGSSETFVSSKAAG